MPYWVFLWIIQHFGAVIISVIIAAALFSENLRELTREADEQCPRRRPSIVEIALKVIVSALPYYFLKDLFAIEEVALLLTVLTVPFVGLILIGTIVNAYELDSIRLFWMISFGDVLGVISILILGWMIASMDQDPFMIFAALVISITYLPVKLAIRFNQ